MSDSINRIRKLAGLKPLMEEHDDLDVPVADDAAEAPEEFTVDPEDMVSAKELTTYTGFKKEDLDAFRDAALALNAKTAKHKKATGHEELVDLHAELRDCLGNCLELVNHLEAFVEPSEEDVPAAMPEEVKESALTNVFRKKKVK